MRDQKKRVFRAKIASRELLFVSHPQPEPNSRQSLLVGHDLKNSQITSVAENSWLALPISISGR